MDYEFKCRVYYEDTDFAGIVYYANYLRFIERARTEALRSLGIDQTLMKLEYSKLFVVKKIIANYYLPAKFDDLLTVRTTFKNVGNVILNLDQDINRNDDLIFSAELKIGVVDLEGKPSKLSSNFKLRLT